MKYSKGVTWIDDCRIPYFKDDAPSSGSRTSNFFEQEYFSMGNGSREYNANQNGRFVPNLLVCDDVLNDSTKPNKGHTAKSKISVCGEFGVGKSEFSGKDKGLDTDSKSRFYNLDLWFDKMLDRL